jgi:betaine lipid synthase
MGQFVDVEEFFSSVYLVDFSPSLCDIARKRFKRLGWKNVKVVCQDARTFRLEDHEKPFENTLGFRRMSTSTYFSEERPDVGGADLITMSYSLSMIVSLNSNTCNSALTLTA